MSAPTSSSILRAGACRQGRYDLSTLSERQRAETEEPITAEYLVVQTGVRLTTIDFRGGSAARIDP